MLELIMELKQNNSIITLLSVLLLTSVIIAGFFAYRTQNLVKEITKLKSVSTPDKTNTQLSPTGYINKKFGYSIDLPVWDGYSAKPSLTDELVGAYGFDHALIQIEPVAYNESNPEKWWAGQTTEYFTKKPASCFNLKNINSVNKTSETNKVIIIHEDTLFGGFGAEIAARIADNCFQHLDAPVKRIAAKDSHIPYAPILENEVLPSRDEIYNGIKDLLKY